MLFRSVSQSRYEEEVEGVEGSVHLIESIDRWGVDVEGCIDLLKYVDWNKYNKENKLSKSNLPV